jgi:hypothetical protein
MDEISGNNSAELLDDGSIEIELAYHDGDQPILKTKRQTETSSNSRTFRKTIARRNFAQCSERLL